jgi:hypothetical protein
MRPKVALFVEALFATWAFGTEAREWASMAFARIYGKAPSSGHKDRILLTPISTP